jgi:hypothetical protein
MAHLPPWTVELAGKVFAAILADIVAGKQSHQIVDRSHLQTIDRYHAEQIVALEYRYAEDCAVSLDVLCSIGVCRVGENIEDVDRPTFKRCARCTAVSALLNWVVCYPLRKFYRGIVSHHHPEQFAIKSENEGTVRSAHLTELSATVSNIALRSNAERLITSSTFDVAVCCSSDSRNSLSSRAFSIAITA